jgi:DNA polymerase
MILIGIDFETRSEVDLVTSGAKKYFHGEEADIVMLSYKIHEGLGKLGQWYPGDPLPDFIKNPKHYKFYAFNALFEYRAWNIIGALKYGFKPIKLNQMIDVMAICGRFSYPQALEKVGTILNLKVQKDKRGKELIKRICCPPFQYTPTEMKEFKEYGLTDVVTMSEMLNALPATQLSQKEQKIWELTQIINLRGIPVDVEAAKQIYKLTEIYKEEQSQRLPELTDGNVTKPTQAQRIVRWAKRQGYNLPNLQAKTVDDALEDPALPKKVKEVLQLRKDLGKSSTAKYKKLIEQEYNGRIYDNLRYYAAGPGRWGGMGFQIHNLARSKVKDAQPIIDKFMDLSIIEENPVQAAKDVVRGMIKAPEGKMICAADYSSIENRTLPWFAGDEDTLELFRNGLDQYVDMASSLYGIPYDEVDDDQRAFGKMLVLGCGYGLGWKGFMKNAANQGVILTPSESQDCVSGYRERYNKVVKFWYACKDAAIAAITNPGEKIYAGETKKVYYLLVKDKNGNIWLQCMLPSGRAIYYNSPMLQEGEYGVEVSAMGIDSYTKKWTRLRIIPGRFVENIVQGFCRDLLAEGKLNLDKEGYYIIGSIHDEVIAELPKSFDNLPLYCELMCKMPSWANGLPMKAKGAIVKRYRKI